jgi:hypothetical protein
MQQVPSQILVPTVLKAGYMTCIQKFFHSLCLLQPFLVMSVELIGYQAA